MRICQSVGLHTGHGPTERGLTQYVNALTVMRSALWFDGPTEGGVGSMKETPEHNSRGRHQTFHLMHNWAKFSNLSQTRSRRAERNVSSAAEMALKPISGHTDTHYTCGQATLYIFIVSSSLVCDATCKWSLCLIYLSVNLFLTPSKGDVHLHKSHKSHSYHYTTTVWNKSVTHTTIRKQSLFCLTN
jgi:hypothetical protein